MLFQHTKPVPAFQPDTKFTDLFKSWSAHVWNPKVKTPEILRQGKSYIQLWLGIPGEYGFDIVITEKLLNWVNDNMIALDHDRIYFEIRDNGDGTFNLYAKYNVIIGQMFLATFDISELPKA